MLISLAIRSIIVMSLYLVRILAENEIFPTDVFFRPRLGDSVRNSQRSLIA